MLFRSRHCFFLLAFLVSILVLTKESSSSSQSSSSSSTWNTIRGIDFFPFNSTVLSSAAIISELDEVVRVGANVVAINFMIVQENATSNVVWASNDTTPTDESLQIFIQEAHSRHLSLFLKPLVICQNTGCEMVNLKPSDPEAWFASYGEYMMSLASFAESNGVEMLSVGLELLLMSSDPALTPYWERLIKDIRTQFSGVLTYSSIFYPFETQRVPFWSSLDMISMDTYVPMMLTVKQPVPTLQQMIQTFDNYFEKVSKWHQTLPANVSSLPILFSEVGYPSSLQGITTPSLNPHKECTGTSAANFTLQQMAFEAFFESAPKYQQELNFLGAVIFWFDNPSSSDYLPDNSTNNWACSWTPRGKPAECTIATAFMGSC